MYAELGKFYRVLRHMFLYTYEERYDKILLPSIHL